MDKKICNKCQKEKDASEFWFNKKKNRLWSYCRKCEKERRSKRYAANKKKEAANHKEWHKRNPGKSKEYAKKYYENNKDKAKAAAKKWAAKNKEKVAAANKAWREANKEHVRQKKNEWRKKNKEKLAGYNRKYREENRDKVNENQRKYYAENVDKLRKYSNKKQKEYRKVYESKLDERVRTFEGCWGPNEVEINNTTMKIFLNEDKTIWTTIDTKDYKLIRPFKWSMVSPNLSGCQYAAAMVSSRLVFMHRIILGLKNRSEFIVDHKDMNGLNNTRKNLRLATMSENLHNVGKRATNTSGYIGVSWNKKHEKWQSKLTVNYKQIFLGLFDCPIEAAKAYDAAKIKFVGKFARTNKMEGLL